MVFTWNDTYLQDKLTISNEGSINAFMYCVYVYIHRCTMYMWKVQIPKVHAMKRRLEEYGRLRI